MQPRLDVRTLPIEKLIPAPYNPRLVLQPEDRRYQKLARSLREFGLVEPLIWNETTGHVVGGHARLAILKALGARAVPVSVTPPAASVALTMLSPATGLAKLSSTQVGTRPSGCYS